MPAHTSAAHQNATQTRTGLRAIPNLRAIATPIFSLCAVDGSLTQIDFEGLSELFTAGKKNTATQHLRAALENRIDRYNAGSLNIDSLFDELKRPTHLLREVRSGLPAHLRVVPRSRTQYLRGGGVEASVNRGDGTGARYGHLPPGGTQGDNAVRGSR